MCRLGPPKAMTKMLSTMMMTNVRGFLNEYYVVVFWAFFDDFWPFFWYQGLMSRPGPPKATTMMLSTMIKKLRHMMTVSRRRQTLNLNLKISINNSFNDFFKFPNLPVLVPPLVQIELNYEHHARNHLECKRDRVVMSGDTHCNTCEI